MTFKKIALVAAIAACAPVGAMAADALDDGSLSDVTGQDGVQIALNLNVNTNAIVHDLDGLGAAPISAGYSFAGAIVMQGVSIAALGSNNPLAPDGVVIRIDAGDNAISNSAPVLNVNVTLNGTTTINTGTLMVGNSRRDNGLWGYDAGAVTIMNNATITLGTTTANIQLGNAPQGHLILLNTAVTNGVTINNVALHDAVNGGDIGSGSVHIFDNGGANLTVNAAVDVSIQGVVITVNQLGSATGMDIDMTRQYLGTTSLGYIGDVELQAVNLAGTTIAISGK